jgi:hypothetical protein
MPSPRSPSQRIKGQEVNLLFTQDGDLLDTLTDIQQFESSAEMETKIQGYLGERSNRTDEIYNHTTLNWTMHIHRATWFTIQQAMIARAQRITPDIVFNVTEVYAFPDGSTVTVTYPDIKFGKQTSTVGSRGDYVTIKCEAVCDSFVINIA